MQRENVHSLFTNLKYNSCTEVQYTLLKVSYSSELLIVCAHIFLSVPGHPAAFRPAAAGVALKSLFRFEGRGCWSSMVMDGGCTEGRKEGGGLEPPPTHQEGCVCCHLLLLSLPSASSSSFTFRPLLCCVIFSGVTLCSFDHYHFHIQLHRHRTPAHPCRESNYTLNP